MSEWNAGQYLRFKNERTQPARDLAARVASLAPKTVVDLGCGPGNSSKVLFDTFPSARIVGVDSSPDMLRKARSAYPDIEFLQGDVSRMEGLDAFDLVFSNACLQWVPDHEHLFSALYRQLHEGAALAVQMPMNEEEPFYRIVDTLVKEDRWQYQDEVERGGVLSVGDYFDLFSSLTDDFQIWQTVYLHRMPSLEAMLEWVKGTRLRPYLNALDEHQQKELEEVILQEARKVYRPRKNGEYLFRFRRFFCVVRKTGSV